MLLSCKLLAGFETGRPNGKDTFSQVQFSGMDDEPSWSPARRQFEQIRDMFEAVDPKGTEELSALAEQVKAMLPELSPEEAVQRATDLSFMEGLQFGDLGLVNLALMGGADPFYKREIFYHLANQPVGFLQSVLAAPGLTARPDCAQELLELLKVCIRSLNLDAVSVLLDSGLLNKQSGDFNKILTAVPISDPADPRVFNWKTEIENQLKILDRVLRESAIDPNVPVSKSSSATLLHQAARLGNVKAVQRLLQHPGIQPHQRTIPTVKPDQPSGKPGQTPLDFARRRLVTLHETENSKRTQNNVKRNRMVQEQIANVQQVIKMLEQIPDASS